MALKDWRKLRETGEKTWKKKQKTLVITGYGYEYPINYILRVFDNRGWMSESLELSRNFKTKSQALKFAKNYMRSF